MLTVVGWQETKAGSTAYAALDACKDQHVRVSGDIIYVPILNQIVGMYVAGGSIADEGYLSTPSLRSLALLDLCPIQKGVSPSGNESVVLHPLNPVPLVTNEGMEVYLKETTTTSQIRTVVALLADGPLAKVSGRIFTLLATATITTIVGEWVNGAITFSQTLPVGRYQIVGCRCKGSTIVAFRFVPIGYSHRPGGIGVNDVGAKDPPEQRYGGLGIWCEFDHLTPPTVELLGGTAAAQSPELYLDLIKVA